MEILLPCLGVLIWGCAVCYDINDSRQTGRLKGIWLSAPLFLYCVILLIVNILKGSL